MWAARSPVAYPLANVVHVLGAVLLVGAIGILDLRLLGAWPALPAAALDRALTPLGIAGLLTMLASGTVLFAADAASLATSAIFQWKLLLIALATANALLFRRLRAGGDARTHPAARPMALASLSMWLAILVLGRLIAYA